MFGIGLSGLVFSLLAYPFIKGGELLSRLPVSMLIGAIGTLCVMGAFIQTHNTFGPIVMVVLGAAMILGTGLGLKVAPLLIGFVLGPGIEKELIRAYQIGGFERFTAPASLVIIAIIVVTLVVGIHNNRKEARQTLTAGTGAAEVDAALAEVQSTDVRSPRKEILMACGGLAFAAYLLFETLNYPLFASLWVYFVALCFIALPSTMMMWRAMRARRAARDSGSIWQDLGLVRAEVIRPVALIVAFVAFIGLIPLLGFLLSTAIFCFGITILMDRSPIRAALVAVGVPALIWVVKTVFSFYLPPGPFGF